jgi:thioredoxin reductase (NADPH)
MAHDPVYEVAIVGGGPIGIELAVALKQAGVSYVHFEAGQVGSTVMWWAPGTRWFSSNERIAIAGVPLVTPDQAKCTREQYLAYLRQIVTMFDLSIRAYEPVVNITRDAEGGYRLTTTPRGGERVTRARRIVLCVGGTDRPRRLNIPGEDLPHVSAYFNEPHAYFRQNLLILGGRNSAVEAALRCHHAGARVAISYRQEKLVETSIKYWLMPEISGYLRAGDISGHFLTTPVAITPTHVTLRYCDAHACRGETFDVPADFVLKLIGYVQDQRLLRACGVELLGDEGRPAYDPQTMLSNVPDIYIAGTAVGGTQERYRVFLENCHVHVDRIVGHITGASVQRPIRTFEREES